MPLYRCSNSLEAGTIFVACPQLKLSSRGHRCHVLSHEPFTCSGDTGLSLLSRDAGVPRRGCLHLSSLLALYSLLSQHISLDFGCSFIQMTVHIQTSMGSHLLSSLLSHYTLRPHAHPKTLVTWTVVPSPSSLIEVLVLCLQVSSI